MNTQDFLFVAQDLVDEETRYDNNIGASPMGPSSKNVTRTNLVCKEGPLRRPRSGTRL